MAQNNIYKMKLLMKVSFFSDKLTTQWEILFSP